MDKKLTPTRKIWFTSYILLIVVIFGYWLIDMKQSPIIPILVGYYIGSIPLAWFLRTRYMEPWVMNKINKRFPRWDTAFSSRFIMNFLSHYITIFLIVFINPFAFPICYILWIVEKQLQLSR